ncbi:MAG TPA: 7-cyano-7-deazaguanine synthase QueC [Kiritimatiellia bacterium]|jgi:7-cyano-7-deazaguanine synthase|nr:7-cyano-7-deazaguanine synthase QueC [Kiritimatiellia bacterium]HOM58954.1 7-cyano-7-deazaguanine synthase QueC [Kiritimatiellia bacterium]HOR96966.1 7-cyano-7-deazaguanine synthase QueC [Kiritimatiellia bacterium]HPW74799.1 7-cyano-7-deazaguanine synthase QueC [Kiritimatiellia bacterium]HRU19225.1 7-cyano-7-deazaguanine synthase QueC [Kiritimatiellia bacterium]
MRKNKAVVIFSGGQDSTTCLAQAIRDYGEGNVSCITFQYGQKHSREVEVAKEIARIFRISDHPILALDWYRQVTTNALLDSDMAIAAGQGGACPNTVVDGRNMLFLLVAAIYAKSRNIRDLIIGVGETDYSGYPDCRDVFVKSCNETLNLAMAYPFRVITPLMHMTKAETWALADKLGILELVAEKTLTCYNGVVGRGCGTCPGCLLRQRGYEAYLARRAHG